MPIGVRLGVEYLLTQVSSFYLQVVHLRVMTMEMMVTILVMGMMSVMVMMMTTPTLTIRQIGKKILGILVAWTHAQMEACSPPKPCDRGVLLLRHGVDEGSRVPRSHFPSYGDRY